MFHVLLLFHVNLRALLLTSKQTNPEYDTKAPDRPM